MTLLRFALRHPWLTLLAIFNALDEPRNYNAPAVGMDDAVPYLGDGTSLAA